MQAPEHNASSAARMIIAFTLFVLAVAGGVYLLVRVPHQPSEIAEVSKAKPAAEDAAGKLFYDAIGLMPQGEETSLGEGPGQATYTLELKVTTSRDEAEQLIDDLQKQGIEAYYTPLTRSGQVVYRVRRGIFTNSKEAGKAALALRKQSSVEAKVIKLQ